MPLKGKAKADYQLDYMRRRRAGLIKPNPPKPKPRPQPSPRSDQASAEFYDMDFDEYQQHLLNLYGHLTVEELERWLDALNDERTAVEVERDMKMDWIIWRKADIELEARLLPTITKIMAATTGSSTKSEVESAVI